MKGSSLLLIASCICTSTFSQKLSFEELSTFKHKTLPQIEHYTNSNGWQFKDIINDTDSINGDECESIAWYKNEPLYSSPVELTYCYNKVTTANIYVCYSSYNKEYIYNLINGITSLGIQKDDATISSDKFTKLYADKLQDIGIYITEETGEKEMQLYKVYVFTYAEYAERYLK